ncbi:hypothetical protein SynROS8604_01583 [Synechococcus sp. ROS8604]|nr:hypothetical protein SynROS8604_01583 [Synechococcus sp. ROS8604]
MGRKQEGIDECWEMAVGLQSASPRSYKSVRYNSNGKY